MDNSNYTILIVEDEEDLLEICEDTFEMECFKVVVARDGEEGLELFLSRDIDLILSDSKMPKMGGIELLNKIGKSHKNTPPFFLLTGDVSLSEDELIKKGAKGLILKPFDLDEIVKKVEATLTER